MESLSPRPFFSKQPEKLDIIGVMNMTRKGRRHNAKRLGITRIPGIPFGMKAELSLDKKSVNFVKEYK